MAALRITNYNMAAARVLSAALFTPLLILGGSLLVAFGFEDGFGTDSLLPIGGGLLFIIGGLGFGVMGARAVLSVTFGETVDIRTLFSRKRYAWDEVKHLRIISQGAAVEVVPLVSVPVARHVILDIGLGSDEALGLQVKSNPRELSALAEIATAHGRPGLLQPVST